MVKGEGKSEMDAISDESLPVATAVAAYTSGLAVPPQIWAVLSGQT